MAEPNKKLLLHISEIRAWLSWAEKEFVQQYAEELYDHSEEARGRFESLMMAVHGMHEVMNKSASGVDILYVLRGGTYPDKVERLESAA